MAQVPRGLPDGLTPERIGRASGLAYGKNSTSVRMSQNGSFGPSFPFEPAPRALLPPLPRWERACPVLDTGAGARVTAFGGVSLPPHPFGKPPPRPSGFLPPQERRKMHRPSGFLPRIGVRGRLSAGTTEEGQAPSPPAPPLRSPRTLRLIPPPGPAPWAPCPALDAGVV